MQSSACDLLEKTIFLTLQCFAHTFHFDVNFMPNWNNSFTHQTKAIKQTSIINADWIRNQFSINFPKSKRKHILEASFSESHREKLALNVCYDSLFNYWSKENLRIGKFTRCLCINNKK